MSSEHTMIAIAMIKDGEGVMKVGGRHVVYDDDTGKPLKQGDTIVGHPTIGHGRHIAAKGISDAEADTMLAHDLEDAEDIARGFVGQPSWQALGDVRRAVLMDMAHNLGAQGLYNFAKLRGAIQRLDWAAAGREIEDSAYFRQVGRRGVRNRDAMTTGAWGEHGGAAAPTERLVPRVPEPVEDDGALYVLKGSYARTPVWYIGGIDGPSSMEMIATTHLERHATRMTKAEVDAAKKLWRPLSNYTVERADLLEQSIKGAK